jgi:hypothetical protein
VVTDKRRGISTAGSTGDAEYYQPDVVSSQDYYAFGALMTNRKFNENAYRYGANAGSEKDDEITGIAGAHTSAEYWEYDARLGRRWNIDPITFPWQSSYATFNNNPNFFNDPLGLTGGGPAGRAPEEGSDSKTSDDGIKSNPNGKIIGNPYNQYNKIIYSIKIIIHHGDRDNDKGWGGKSGGHAMINFGDNNVYGFTGGWSLKLDDSARPKEHKDGTYKQPKVGGDNDNENAWYSEIHGNDHYGDMKKILDGKIKGGGLTSIFEIQVSEDQYNSIKDWYNYYSSVEGESPYPYQFLGKRCAGSVYNELKRSGIIKNQHPLNAFFNAANPGFLFHYLWRGGYYNTSIIQKGGLTKRQKNKTLNFYNRKLREKYGN